MNSCLGENQIDINTGYIDLSEDFRASAEEKIHHLRYGIEVCNVNLLFNKNIPCEAIPKATVYPIPNRPPWLLGMINFRGNPVPVFNLYNDFSDGFGDIVFVIAHDEQACAIMISTLPIAVRIDEDALEKLAVPENIPDFLKGSVQQVYNIQNVLWMEVDHDVVINNLMIARQCKEKR